MAELDRLYVQERRPLPREVERALAADPRAGARAVLARVRARRRDRRAENRRLAELLRYERDLWGRGISTVAGLDEVGMGPMAGPICAGAVVLAEEARLEGIDDSKRLTAEQREALVPAIEEEARGWALGWVAPAEINVIGLYRGGQLAMRRAFEALAVRTEAALVDGPRRPPLPVPVTPIVKGDQLSMSIAAASVLAKVARDAHMVTLDAAWPGYGFAQHKGYPVPAHKEALARLGATPIHRHCFALVREAMR